MFALLAQIHSLHGWGFGEILIAIVIIAACIGIALVAMHVFEVSPPAWAVKIFWIVCCAAVAILAIRFVLTL